MRLTSSLEAVLIFAALMRTAIGLVPGNSSRMNCNRFRASPALLVELPVRFASGRLMLVTKPFSTASPPDTKTTGMVEVAALAASVGKTPPKVAITATRRRTKSAANSASRAS